MRRDVYIENDSGGFSVLAADAVDDIIEDARSDDARFVTSYKALLLELYGDDSMPVRIVVDEPLQPEEEAQWLARASWRIDTSDGRLLVMGGFDPDVLTWWKDAGGEGDGRGIGAFSAAPGSWNVDVYAHVGSMNGRVILSETDEKPGAAFRRSHPDRPFPLWLAHMLEFSGEDDPGFEDLWKDVRGSMLGGRLAVDTGGGDAIGFLVHVTRSSGTAPSAPEEIWFDRSANMRIPSTFPIGLVSEAPDPGLRSFHDKLLDIKHPEPERPVADRIVEIIEVWPGDPIKAVDGGAVAVPPGEVFLLHWMAALISNSTPRFELWVAPKGAWTPPTATPDFAVIAKNQKTTAIGPVANTGGWHTWWTSRSVAESLGNVPDGSEIDLAMVPTLDIGEEGRDPRVGRALYSGIVKDGAWEVAYASPKVSKDALEAAVEFARDVAIHSRLRVRPGPERQAFDAKAEMYGPMMGAVHWEADGETMRLADPDERMLIMLATPVFRARFADVWPVEPEEEDDDED